MITIRLAGIAATIAAIALLQIPPAEAAHFFFSANGGGATCSLAAPCTLSQAIASATAGDEIACADSTDNPGGAVIVKALTIDCSGTTGSIQTLTLNGNVTLVLRNLTMAGGAFALNFQGGTLILDNVHITGTSNNAINGAPQTSSATLIVRNSVFDGSQGGGIVLKPVSGGAVSARFDHVTITGNANNGMRFDSTSGPVTVDITNSEISSNGGLGINVVGLAGGSSDLVSISRSVISRNGSAGIQANGPLTAALLDTTLLDSNNGGGINIVAGGRVVTYGTNRPIDSLGSGFTGTVPLQ